MYRHAQHSCRAGPTPLGYESCEPCEPPKWQETACTSILCRFAESKSDEPCEPNLGGYCGRTPINGGLFSVAANLPSSPRWIARARAGHGYPRTWPGIRPWNGAEASTDLVSTVPKFVIGWLPDLDECENFLEIILFSLPSPLVDAERPFMGNPTPARTNTIEQAFEFQRLLDERLVNSRAEIAERCGISRARVTQVLNLLKLPPELLSLLAVSSDGKWSERQLRGILALRSQEDRIAAARATFPKSVLADSQPA